MRLHLFGFLLFFGLALSAAPASADPSFECSIDASSQVETGACLEDVEARVEKVLEAAINGVTSSMAELDEVTQRTSASDTLVVSQSAWEAYRDAHCNFVGATYGGGSGTGIAIRSCRIELARTRIAALLFLSN